MHIEQMMDRAVITVAPDTDFATLLARHARSDARHTYVVDGANRLLGVITSHDMLGRMVPAYLTPGLAATLPDGAELVVNRFKENAGLKASELMRREVVTLKPGDTLVEANVLLREGRFNALPVVDASGTLVGDVSRKDLLRHIAQDICGLSLVAP